MLTIVTWEILGGQAPQDSTISQTHKQTYTLTHILTPFLKTYLHIISGHVCLILEEIYLNDSKDDIVVILMYVELFLFYLLQCQVIWNSPINLDYGTGSKHLI